MVPRTHPSPTASPRTNVSGLLFKNAMKKGEPPLESWNRAVPSEPSWLIGSTAKPSGSGAFDAIDRSEPPCLRTQRIGEPSGLAEAGSSNVVPTKRNRPLGAATTMVDTRLGLSCVLTVYRSGRSVSLPASSTDIRRTWSGPNEWSTYRVPEAGAHASAFAVPLLPSTGFPVASAWTSVSRPLSSQRKLETELSPPFVANRKRLSGERITLAAPSNAFGALSWPLIGLNVPE